MFCWRVRKCKWTAAIKRLCLRAGPNHPPANEYQPRIEDFLNFSLLCIIYSYVCIHTANLPFHVQCPRVCRVLCKMQSPLMMIKYSKVLCLLPSTNGDRGFRLNSTLFQSLSKPHDAGQKCSVAKIS